MPQQQLSKDGPTSRRYAGVGAAERGVAALERRAAPLEARLRAVVGITEAEAVARGEADRVRRPREDSEAPSCCRRIAAAR